ncbi:MAG TPA: hypothetical protein VFQ92_08110 [Blastocatellia bacterium]|nr:hypothetical protein [Blastocatellia bacterium]
MKSLFLLLLFSPFFLPAAPAQVLTDSPLPITIIKNSWAKFRYRPGWDNQSLPNQAGTPSRNPNTISNPNRRRLPRVIEGFAYKATVRNISQRTVVEVGWDYTFTDPGSKKMTHHEFKSRIRIKPGEKKELIKYVGEPPTRVVSAGGGGKEMIEEVRIMYVEYEDGSRWEGVKQ